MEPHEEAGNIITNTGMGITIMDISIIMDTDIITDMPITCRRQPQRADHRSDHHRRHHDPEFVGGLLTNSLALLSDSAHMLSDTAAIALSLAAFWFAARFPSANKSYGYYRFEILAALFNGLTLLSSPASSSSKPTNASSIRRRLPEER